MTLRSNLTALETSGLIRLAQAQPELEYLFKHALVQDAAYSSILKQDRKKLHHRIGETLEMIYAQRLEEVAPILAEHFDKAEDEASALKYYTLAADAAAHVYANNEAAMHYARALALAQHGDAATSVQLMHLFTSYGRVLELLHRYPEALRMYEEMQTFAQTRGDKLMELTSLITRITMFSTPTPFFDTARGRELFEPTLALARDLNDQQVEVKILWMRLLNSYFSGNFREGLPYGEQALALARAINDRGQLTFVLNDISRSYLSIGQPERALAVLAEARTLWLEFGNRPMLADCLVSTAETYLLMGDYQTTLRLTQEGYDVAHAIGNTWGENFALTIAGYAHIELGNFDSALENLVKGTETGIGMNIQFLWGVTGDLAFLYAQLGAPQRGLELLQRMVPKLENIAGYLHCWVLGGFVHVYLAQGDLDRAAEIWARVAESYDPENFFGFAPFVIGLGECYLSLAQHDYVNTIAHCDKFINLMQHYQAIGYIPETLSIKAQAFTAQGHLTEARELLREACEWAQKLNARRQLWKILFHWSEVEQQLGHETEHRRLLGESRQVLNYILEHLAIPDLRASFLNTPEVRAVLSNP